MTCKFPQYITLTWLLAVGGAATAETLLTNVTIVDVESGGLTDDQSILIRDGLIEGIGANLAPGSADVVDGAGGYLIPGLWDTHVHIFSTTTEPDTALPLYLISGITGIRDMGALWPIEDQKALQSRIAEGEVLGPRLILSVAWVDASPGSWPGMFLADTPDEVSDIVAQIANEGWAAVKSYSMLNEETYRALADASAAHNLPLVGHIPEQVALQTAIDAGQAGMEHFGRIPMACATDEVRALAKDSIALDRQTFAMAHAAGVPILASSDASFANPFLFHGFSLLDELDIYVSAGLAPREALFTATVAPPRFFDLLDQDGTITPGQRADLVLLAENPLTGLATLRTPQAVIVGGVILDRTALDALEADLRNKGQ